MFLYGYAREKVPMWIMDNYGTSSVIYSNMVMLPFLHRHSFCWSVQIPQKIDVSPWISQYPWTLYSTQITKTAKHQGRMNDFPFLPPVSDPFRSFFHHFTTGPWCFGGFRAGRMSPLTCGKSLDVWALRIERPFVETGRGWWGEFQVVVGGVKVTPYSPQKKYEKI